MPGEEEVSVASGYRVSGSGGGGDVYGQFLGASGGYGCGEWLVWRFWRGVNKYGIVPHDPADSEKEIPEDRLPPGDRILSVLPAGGAVLIQHKTIHTLVSQCVRSHSLESGYVRYSDYRLPTGREEVP